jgi:hypothetical protein
MAEELYKADLFEEVSPPEDGAMYFPLDNGRYEVKPGLFSFGTPMGNGVGDEQVFQIDGNFAPYRRVKMVARAEALEKYYRTCRYVPEVAVTVARFIAERLVEEHGDCFVMEEGEGGMKLHCKLSGEVLRFDEHMELRGVEGAEVDPAYASALDALSAQVQEDVAVVCRDAEGGDWVAAIHLCHANHWSAAEKIGLSFAAVHAPVAGMEAMNRRADALVGAMIDRGPYVRFAWGIATDARLNHHPQAPDGIEWEVWRGRRFERDKPRLFLRVERQVLWGFPQVGAALFTIRAHFIDGEVVRKKADWCDKLCSAIESMSAAALQYKGLGESRDDILAWLRD